MKEKYNKVFCCSGCQKEYTLKNNPIYCCEICGFDKIIEAHHIIKKMDYGSDNFNNLIFLCPNHHKMADSSKYSNEMKKLIFEKTGKTGEKLSDKEILEVNAEIQKMCLDSNNLSFGWNIAKRFILAEDYCSRMRALKEYKKQKNNLSEQIYKTEKILKKLESFSLNSDSYDLQAINKNT